jgi:hypothetical protein
MDGQHIAVTSIDEILDSVSLGMDLVSHAAGFGNGGLMKLSAEVPADGTLPIKGKVQWLAGIEQGINGADPYGTYPAGHEAPVECVDEFYPDGTAYPDLPPGVPVDGQTSGVTYPIDIDGTDPNADGSNPEYPSEFIPSEEVLDEAGQALEISDSGVAEFPGVPEKADCADLIAQTGVVSVNLDDPEDPSSSAESYPDSAAGEGRTMVSEWKLIEVDGVRMIEIQLPLILRQEANGDNEEAMLLVEHEGFVRLGARLPESFSDRVITYNETAFTTLRSIVEMGIDSRQ